MDGEGKIHRKMDDDWGYPYDETETSISGWWMISDAVVLSIPIHENGQVNKASSSIIKVLLDTCITVQH